MDKKLPQNLSRELSEKFQIENNTLKRDVKDNPKDRIQVEIGDSKASDFKPQAKIMRWENEVNFSLRAVEHPDAVIETEGRVVKYKTPDYEVHQYELDPSEIGEDGGLEFEWVLPKKPSSNVLQATIQTKELNFFKQNPLNQEKLPEGHTATETQEFDGDGNVVGERPANVVGSYAVYHKTKGGVNRADGMEYKVGKAFHIYRPKVTDAEGNETWGELNIDEQNGLLSVTVDEEWLERAIYPVVVDPTFGNTSIGASLGGGGGTDRLQGAYYTSPGDAGGASVQNLTVYPDPSGEAINIKAVIFDYTAHTGGTILTNGVGQEVLAPDEPEWVTSSFGTDPTISASTDYGLSIVWESGSFHQIAYDATGGNRGFLDSGNDYATPTNPSLTTSELDRNYSIYATYTASATTSTSTTTSTTTTSTSSSTSTTTTSTSSSTSTTTTTTSSSTSTTSTSSSTSTTTTLDPTSGGLAFGEENPNQGETAVSWQTWSDGASGTPDISGDPDWGKLQLDLTEEGRSKVYDFGSSASRQITLTENRYGTGQGSADLQYRVSDSAFAQDDASPSWTNYSSPFSETFRYIQIREINQ